MPPPSSSRNITDFFKPRSQSQQSTWAPSRSQQADPRGGRHWPSPRVESRFADPSSQLPTPSPLTTQRSERSAGAYSIKPEPPTLYKTVVPTTGEPAVETNPPSSSSGLPRTSQVSYNSVASHRVIKNGEQVVTNSDSDSESSDSDLPSLDFGSIKYPPPRKPLSNGMKPHESENNHGTRSSLSVLGHKRAFKGPIDGHSRRPAPSLNFLIEATRKDTERAEKIARIKAHLDEPIPDAPPPQEEKLDESTMAAVLQGEEGRENAERVLLAMKRTNALQLSCVWRCFNEANAKKPPKRPFPSNVLRQKWAASFKDSHKREQAFLSGYARQVFQYQQLPEELAEWMIDQLTMKPGDSLNAAYLQIFTDRRQNVGKLLSWARLEEMFRILGAKEELTGTGKIVPSYEPSRGPVQPLHSSLKWILRLLNEVGADLPPESRLRTLSTLMVMSFDYHVLADAELGIMIQDAIEAIISSIPDLELASTLGQLTDSLLDRITQPVLQNNLVSSIPTTSPRTAYFQRQLALAFLFHPTRINLPLDSPSLPALVQSHLRSSTFKITHDTDYSSLAALFSLLDIVIGPGLATVPYLPPPTTSSAISTAHAPLPPISAEEKAFNSQVDELAQQIRILSNDIQEVGVMSNPSKMDAKERSERLVHRLESTVRTRGRARKVFGEVVEEGQEKVQIGLGKWFGRKMGES